MYGGQLENKITGLSSSNNVAPPPRKISQTEQELDFLTGETKKLLSFVTLLRNHLQPVLRNSTDKEDVGKPIEELPPLPNLIRENRFNVASANSQLTDLLDRLEI